MVEHKRETEAFVLFTLLNTKKHKMKDSVHHGAASHQPEGGRPKFWAAACSCGAVENNPQLTRANPNPPAIHIGIVDLSRVRIDGTTFLRFLIPNITHRKLVHQMNHDGMFV